MPPTNEEYMGEETALGGFMDETVPVKCSVSSLRQKRYAWVNSTQNQRSGFNLPKTIRTMQRMD